MTDAITDYQLIRSNRRKTLAIKVSPTGVEVRAPQFVAKSDIEAFVHEKRHWIERHLQRFAAQPPQETYEKCYTPGELFQYLGNDYPLALSHGKTASVQLTSTQLNVVLSNRMQGTASQVKRLLEQWYRHRALAVLSEKSHQQAARLGKSVGDIRVRRTRSKWGHCTIKGDLQYNWLIMAAPEAVIDYLVAHEVSHLVHHNHSPAFWQQVAMLCPDWKQQRAWLKQHGYTLRV